MVNLGLSHSPQRLLKQEGRAEEHQQVLSQGPTCKGVDNTDPSKGCGQRGARHAKAVWAGSLWKTAGDSLGWVSLWQPD